MTTTTTTVAEAGAVLAWRRRIARVGSLIQLGFAALWFLRGALATSWTARLWLATVLLAVVLGLGVWAEVSTRSAAPRPAGVAARRIERAVTIATVLQLAASFALPVIVASLDRPDLTVASVSVTIGMLLLWLWARRPDTSSPERCYLSSRSGWPSSSPETR